MEFVVAAPSEGTLLSLLVASGDLVREGQRLACFQPRHSAVATAGATAANAANAANAATSATATATPSPSSSAAAAASLDAPPRTDLARVLARRAATEDEPRAAADARYAERRRARHAEGRRTAREQVAALVDSGSFREYGRHAIAAQLGRSVVSSSKWQVASGKWQVVAVQ